MESSESSRGGKRPRMRGISRSAKGSERALIRSADDSKVVPEKARERGEKKGAFSSGRPSQNEGGLSAKRKQPGMSKEA